MKLPVQWPRGLRRSSAAARLLNRIPPGAWMSVCCECCVLSGRGLCDELSLVQRRGVLPTVVRRLCVSKEKPCQCGGHSPRWAAAPKEKIYI